MSRIELLDTSKGKIDIVKADERSEIFWLQGKEYRIISPDNYSVIAHWEWSRQNVIFWIYYNSVYWNYKYLGNNKVKFIFSHELVTDKLFCGHVSRRFVSEFSGLDFDAKFYNDFVLPEIFNYIFVNLLKFEQVNNTFRFVIGLYYDYVFSPARGRHLFRHRETVLINSAGEEISPEKILQFNDTHLISRVYHKSAFTLDIPIAARLVYLWISTIYEALEKFKDMVKQNILFKLKSKF